MAAYNYFNNYVNALDTKQIALGTDVFKVMLTNTAAVATNTQYSDISATELANGNGYTTGGGTVASTSVTNTSGTDTFIGNAVSWTAGPSTMGPFRYAVLYDSTPTTKYLVGWWDYGSSITLNSGEQFSWQPNNQLTGGTIYTLTHA